MKKKKIYWSSTEVKVSKTIAEINECLIESGCTGIAMEYDSHGRVTSLFFKIMFLDKTIPYRMPCRTECLIKTYKDMGQWINAEKAEMIAWRQVLYWLKGQMAIIGTNMVSVHEVFLPYRQVGLGGTTLYQVIENKGTAFLEHLPQPSAPETNHG